MNKKRKEFSEKLVVYDVAKAKIIRKELIEKFIRLKIKVKTIKGVNSSEEIKMAEELIELCEAKYGKDFEQLDRTNIKKIQTFHQAVNNLTHEIEKNEKGENEELDEQIL